MRIARAEAEVALAPEQALGLWTDLGRWPSFIEGFARQVETDSGWPAEGAPSGVGLGRRRARPSDREGGRVDAGTHRDARLRGPLGRQADLRVAQGRAAPSSS